MALIECSECGHQVSDKANFCPNCGNPEIRSNASTPLQHPAPDLPSTTPAPDTRMPPALPTAGNTPDVPLCELRFKQTRQARNRKRSVLPRLAALAVACVLGYFVWQKAPAISGVLGGKPSTREIVALIESPMTTSVRLQGVEIPQQYLDVDGITVDEVTRLEDDGGSKRYHVTGTATLVLTVNGSTITNHRGARIGQHAQQLNFAAARQSVYDMVRSHNALQGIAAGHRLTVDYTVILKRRDGRLALETGRTITRD